MTKQYAFILGIIFLAIGILGFVDPLVPDGRLLGIFAVNAPHNLFHILAGLFGIWAGRTDTPRAGLAFTWFVLLAYGLLALMGFLLIRDNSGMLLGFIHTNMADNWLHLLLALSALVVLFSSQRRPVYR